MDFLGENAGLSADQTEKVLQFQELTGIEDVSVCRDVLQRHQWNLEVAVQEQLNIKEGRPSVYATEARPPQVVSDHIAQHFFHISPSDGSAGGLRGFVRNVIRFFVSFCYNSLLSIINTAVRILGGQDRASLTNPIEDVMSFIQMYDEKYSAQHPVFYRGTYSQVLNDAKRELKFLVIYLHNDESADATDFCRRTLSDPAVVAYINQHCFFWGCSVATGEGRRVAQLLKPSHFPFAAVVVLRDGRMTIVGRIAGHCPPETLHRNLASIVAAFEVNLVSARADRVEQSLNRSLRAFQDEAFMESLRADQEKDRRREQQRQAEAEEQRRIEQEAQAEVERKQKVAREKLESASKVPAEPDVDHPDCIHVVIKLPCGTRLDRRFLKTHSLEAIFYFVFCHPKAPDEFEITTNFPKRVLYCGPARSKEIILTLEQAGLQHREMLFVNDLDA